MFKDIAGYEGLYGITSCGRVWSYRRKKFLKAQKDKKGYQRVVLHKDGKVKNFLVHRLVSEAYVPNPQGLETVDHIDGCKDHNYVGNLQWLTRGDNVRKSQNIPVYCVELNQDFESIIEASRQLGLNPGNIYACCLGKRQTTGNLHFKFVQEGDTNVKY